jgi:hypothetical protein
MRRLGAAARSVGAPVEVPSAYTRDHAVARALTSMAATPGPVDQEALPPIPIAGRQRSAHLGGIAAAIVAVAVLTAGGVILSIGGNGSPSSSSPQSQSAALPSRAAEGAPEHSGIGSPSALQLRPVIGSTGSGCGAPAAGAALPPSSSTEVSNDAARPVAGAEAECVQLGPALLTLSPPRVGVRDVTDAAAGYSTIVITISPADLATITRWQDANVFGSLAAVAGDAVIGFASAAGAVQPGKQASLVEIIYVTPSTASQETADLGGH